MSSLAIESGAYVAPEGLEDFGDRVVDGKKIILYIGDTAFVDVVEVRQVDNKEVLGAFIRRIESTPDRAVDLLHHTSLFIPQEEADHLFGDSQAA